MREKTILQGIGYMMGFGLSVSERNGGIFREPSGRDRLYPTSYIVVSERLIGTSTVCRPSRFGGRHFLGAIDAMHSQKHDFWSEASGADDAKDVTENVPYYMVTYPGSWRTDADIRSRSTLPAAVVRSRDFVCGVDDSLQRSMDVLHPPAGTG